MLQFYDSKKDSIVSKNADRSFFSLYGEDLLSFDREEHFEKIIWKVDKRLLWLSLFRSNRERPLFGGPQQRAAVKTKKGWAGVQKSKIHRDA